MRTKVKNYCQNEKMNSVKAQVKMKKKREEEEWYSFCTTRQSPVTGPRFLTSQQPSSTWAPSTFHAPQAHRAKFFTVCTARNQRNSTLRFLPTVWSCQSWQTNPTASSQACYNWRTLTCSKCHTRIPEEYSDPGGLSPEPWWNLPNTGNRSWMLSD